MSNISSVTDLDPTETREWLDSLDAVVSHSGESRARFLVGEVMESARLRGVLPRLPLNTDYVNTLPPDNDRTYPGDPAIEKRIRRIVRWNAMAMVQRANTNYPGLGGHLATYASSASLYEMGFNHFFRGRNESHPGDQIYFQGHAAPGIYSRAFLEGRLSQQQLEHFRRESSGNGLSSYPHPRLMPDFWQFPTVSMGIGAINAIYQARFNRYISARGIYDAGASHVWCYMGDGECDEPESLGQLSIAAREGLDNLTFVINCNLQRLDGPVRGNGKIMQELEAIFHGAGWNVIKCVWGPEWDALLAKDHEGVLRKRMNEIVDGQMQRYTNASGDFIRQDFFGKDPRLLEMVKHLTDDEICKLRRGGHSFRKLYAAYEGALNHKGAPTVILAQTVKGWTLGSNFEGANTSHQKKKLDYEDLKKFRDLLELEIPDSDLKEAPFYHPGEKSDEVQYIQARREALGGPLPARDGKPRTQIQLPAADLYEEFYTGMAKGEASTTMVFSRLLSKLIRDKQFGKRVVPIIPDEARTFGLDALFSAVGIYSSKGQLYEPVDKGNLMYYREATNGQVLEEGITEAGSMASFTAAATSYSVHGETVVPFYIFYSMFGFQRTGDQMWAACDSLGRGFVLGATAGRTTLNGEGLQHEDGHSHVLASTMPGFVAYDFSFAFEVAVVIKDGLRRMYENEENILYYLTLHNENYAMPPMPAGAEQGILDGIYRFSKSDSSHKQKVQLFGSGPMMVQAMKAKDILEQKYGVACDLWGVTSYTELRRDALECDRYNRLHPLETARIPKIAKALDGVQGPFIAASDYMKVHAEQIMRWIPGHYEVLGTDGYGMSDTREALRRHFEVDAESIVIAALNALRVEGKVDAKLLAKAIEELGVDAEKRSAMAT